MFVVDVVVAVVVVVKLYAGVDIGCCRPKAVRGNAKQTAKRRRCQTVICAFWDNRGVYHPSRP